MVEPHLLTGQLLHTVQQRNGEFDLFCLLFSFFCCRQKYTGEVQGGSKCIYSILYRVLFSLYNELIYILGHLSDLQ